MSITTEDSGSHSRRSSVFPFLPLFFSMSAEQTGMDRNKIKGKTAAPSPERTCVSHMEDSELNASDGLFAALQLFLTSLACLFMKLGLSSKEITTYTPKM